MKLYDILFLILLLLILFKSPNQKINEFSNEDYYESFWPAKECFKLYHDNPTGPPFLVIGIIYGLYSIKSGNLSKRVSRKYQIRKINGTCTNYPAIKTLDKDFSTIILIIFVTLYFKHKYTIAFFNYKFNRNFVPSPYKLVYIGNKFGLEVVFSDSSNTRSLDYEWGSQELNSYLRYISKKDGYICVITPSKYNILLSPVYLYPERGLIIGINFRFIKNGVPINIMQYPASECDPNKIHPVETVYLIEDGSDLNI